jgi:hypothetical protein
MSVEHQGKKDDVSAKIADLESQFFGRPRRGRATEQLLWAYALGILSIEEKDAAHSLIAGDDQAQERLAQIHRVLEGERADLAAASELSEETTPAAAAGATVGSFLQLLKERALGLLEELTLKPAEVAVVLARVPGGFLPALVGAGCTWQAGRPDYLGDEQAGGGPAEEQPRPLAELRLPDGTKLQCVDVQGQGFDIIITPGNTRLAGRVRVYKRTGTRPESWEPVRGRTVPLDQGKAQIRNCPEGILKLELPDRTTIVLGVQSKVENGPSLPAQS